VRAEILIDDRMFPRGATMLRAMIEAAPIPIKVRRNYVGDCELLMVYGMGHPVRRPWQFKHLAKGGRLIGWDLGYWAREGPGGQFSMRCTIDADHPHALLREEPPERWDRERIALREDADPRGPIVLIGLGPKANRMLGTLPLAWERGALKRIRSAYPGRPVVFKPKRGADDSLPGVPSVSGPIEHVLRGASLVVCRHSNVAVDACIAGVPVVCHDGAAVALYGSCKIANPAEVTPEQRLAFLRELAWWQWKPTEAKDAWTYLLSRLSG
jgi:hypothetical protein